jgi:hypothetical protein
VEPEVVLGGGGQLVGGHGHDRLSSPAVDPTVVRGPNDRIRRDMAG